MSACGSESYRAAQKIEHLFRHASYSKNTADFLAKLRQIKVKHDTLLIIMAVESMYTNTDHDSGLATLRKAFLDNPDPRRSDKCILKLLEINHKIFSQNSWLVMGKKLPHHMPVYLWQLGN